MSDETRETSTTGGQKGRKLERMSLIPRYPLEVLARHYAIGAEKYEDHNWRQGYPWSWSYDSLLRHLLAFWDGEDIDEETGSPHLAGVLFHVMALIQFTKDFPEHDDRFKPVPKPEEASWWFPAVTLELEGLDPEVFRILTGLVVLPEEHMRLFEIDSGGQATEIHPVQASLEVRSHPGS